MFEEFKGEKVWELSETTYIVSNGGRFFLTKDSCLGGSFKTLKAAKRAAIGEHVSLAKNQMFEAGEGNEIYL